MSNKKDQAATSESRFSNSSVRSALSKMPDQQEQTSVTRSREIDSTGLPIEKRDLINGLNIDHKTYTSYQNALNCDPMIQQSRNVSLASGDYGQQKDTELDKPKITAVEGIDMKPKKEDMLKIRDQDLAPGKKQDGKVIVPATMQEEEANLASLSDDSSPVPSWGQVSPESLVGRWISIRRSAKHGYTGFNIKEYDEEKEMHQLVYAVSKRNGEDSNWIDLRQIPGENIIWPEGLPALPDKMSTGISKVPPERKSLLSLPTELILKTVSRVPQQQNHTLRMVNRAFNKFIRSEEFKKLQCQHYRSGLLLRFSRGNTAKWFTLQKTMIEDLLTPFPEQDVTTIIRRQYITDGTYVYMLCSSADSVNVLVMDARRRLIVKSSAPIDLIYGSAGVVSGILYVFGFTGGNRNIQLYDIATDSWRSGLDDDHARKIFYTWGVKSSETIGKTIYLFRRNIVCTYNTDSGVTGEFNSVWGVECSSVFQDLLFAYSEHFGLLWFDVDAKALKETGFILVEKRINKRRSLGLGVMNNSLMILHSEVRERKERLKEEIWATTKEEEIWATTINLKRASGQIFASKGNSDLLVTLPYGFKLDLCLSV